MEDKVLVYDRSCKMYLRELSKDQSLIVLTMVRSDAEAFNKIQAGEIILNFSLDARLVHC